MKLRTKMFDEDAQREVNTQINRVERHLAGEKVPALKRRKARPTRKPTRARKPAACESQAGAEEKEEHESQSRSESEQSDCEG